MDRCDVFSQASTNADNITCPTTWTTHTTVCNPNVGRPFQHTCKFVTVLQLNFVNTKYNDVKLIQSFQVIHVKNLGTKFFPHPATWYSILLRQQP